MSRRRRFRPGPVWKGRKTKNAMTDNVLQIKRRMRAEAAARRALQTDPEGLSREIFRRLAALPEYLRARTVLLYLDVRNEVRTRWFAPAVLAEGNRLARPYCERGEIELFRFNAFDELAPGAKGILEPTPELRRRAERRIEPTELDFLVIPGVAFDRRGGRLGHGHGYFDKLLSRVRADAIKTAVCFECQLFDAIPTLPHDVPMDWIVTEKAAYRIDRTLSKRHQPREAD